MAQAIILVALLAGVGLLWWLVSPWWALCAFLCLGLVGGIGSDTGDDIGW